jgi:hypothetical protein
MAFTRHSPECRINHLISDNFFDNISTLFIAYNKNIPHPLPGGYRHGRTILDKPSRGTISPAAGG